jgi:hypothetical protein
LLDLACGPSNPVLYCEPVGRDVEADRGPSAVLRQLGTTAMDRPGFVEPGDEAGELPSSAMTGPVDAADADLARTGRRRVGEVSGDGAWRETAIGMGDGAPANSATPLTVTIPAAMDRSEFAGRTGRGAGLIRRLAAT